MNLTTPKVVRSAGISLTVVLAALLVVRANGYSQQISLQSEFAEKLGPLDPAAYASPVVPDEQNAAIWLRAGAAALVLSKEDKDIVADLGFIGLGEWSAEQQQELHRILVRNAPALEVVHRAGGMKQSSYGLTGTEQEFKPNLPLLDLLWIQRLLDLEARQALKNSDGQDLFWQSAGAMAAIAASLEREAPLISQLVGIAAEKIFLEVVREAIDTGALDKSALVRLDGMLLDVDLRAAWRRSLASEGAGGWTPESNRKWLQGAGLTGDTRLRLILDVAGTIDRPFGAFGKGLPEAVSDPKTAGDLRATFARAAGRYQTVMTVRRLARLSLGLRRQAQETGTYPDSLAGVPPASRSDPFTGTTLEYERRTDGSARLTAPGASALADALYKPVKNFSRFTWELPAPGKVVAKR